MTEIPAAGAATSGRRACTGQYPDIRHSAYRGAADGGHGKLYREQRQYPAGGTGGIRHGRAGRAFRPQYRRAYCHEGSRRQYRGQFRDKHLVCTQRLATACHGRDKGRA